MAAPPASLVVSLPHYEPFQVHGASAEISSRWKSWIRRFENLLTFKMMGKKKALFLHYVGADVEEIFENINVATDPQTYAQAKLKLSTHFAPACNTVYETLVFRDAKQNKEETMDQFYTRLRRLSSTCGFTDVDRELKIQIIQGSTLRTKYLREPKLTLIQTLDLARSHELSNAQANGIETASGTNPTYQKPLFNINRGISESRPVNQSAPTTFTICGFCGGNYPHPQGRPSCPASGRQCSNCGGMGHFAKYCRSKSRHISSQPSPNSSTVQNQPRTNLPTQRGRSRQRRGSRNTQSVRAISETPGSAVHNIVQSPANAIVQSLEEASSTLERSTLAECDDSDESLYTATSNASLNTSSPPSVIVPIEQSNITWIFDTGSFVNIMDQEHFNKIVPKPMLSPYGKSIFTYSSRTSLPSLGIFTNNLTYKGITVSARIIVVPTQGSHTKPILSHKTCEDLGLIVIVRSLTESTKTVLEKYPNLFEGVGLLKNKVVKLHINPMISPIAQPNRKVPFHLREALDAELEKLERMDIIEPSIGPTPWISPLVIVPKPKKSPTDPQTIRVCVI